MFLLPVAHVAERCPSVSRKTMLIVSILIYSLAMGAATLTRNGIVLDTILGVAGLACAAHVPITSSILTSIYPVPSTRRHCVFTFFLAGGNAFAVVLGSLGSGLVNVSLDGDWRASFIYIATLYALVSIVSALVIPNIPRHYPNYIISSSSGDRFALWGRSIKKRSAVAD